MVIIKEAKTEYDNQGNELSPEQIAYFKNSKVRDDNGNLMVCYHGTQNPGFDEFDARSGNSRFGRYKFNSRYNVNYFTASEFVAQGYTDIGVGKVGENIYACYLNITNPYIVDNHTDAEIKSWQNIKDRKIRDKEVQVYNSLYNFCDKYSYDDIDDWINKLNYYFDYLGYELIRDDDYDEYDLYTLPKNTMFGSNTREWMGLTTLEDLRDYLDDELNDQYHDSNSYYFTVDDIIKYVFMMNEEDGTNYDGIIVSDIFDVGPEGSVFDARSQTTDIITISSANQIKSIYNKNPTNSNKINESTATTTELSTDEIIDELSTVFYVSDEPVDGPVFILSDGRFLSTGRAPQDKDSNSSKYYIANYHSLVDAGVNSLFGYEKYKVRLDDGSDFMREINAVRANSNYSSNRSNPWAYMELPAKNLTSSQYYALEDWIEFLGTNTYLDIYTSQFGSEGGEFKAYNLKNYLPEDIIKLIKRYYSSGILYEKTNQEMSSV